MYYPNNSNNKKSNSKNSKDKKNLIKKTKTIKEMQIQKFKLSFKLSSLNLLKLQQKFNQIQITN